MTIKWDRKRLTPTRVVYKFKEYEILSITCLNGQRSIELYLNDKNIDLGFIPATLKEVKKIVEKIENATYVINNGKVEYNL